MLRSLPAAPNGAATNQPRATPWGLASTTVLRALKGQNKLYLPKTYRPICRAQRGQAPHDATLKGVSRGPRDRVASNVGAKKPSVSEKPRVPRIPVFYWLVIYT